MKSKIALGLLGILTGGLLMSGSAQAHHYDQYDRYYFRQHQAWGQRFTPPGWQVAQGNWWNRGNFPPGQYNYRPYYNHYYRNHNNWWRR